MAYEALIVIGFGVALAVTSVALFWAHVKRINAPNKADPEGTLVEIDLGGAIAEDEAARMRKVASTRSKDLRRGGAALFSSSVEELTSGVGKRPLCTAGDDVVVEAGEEAVEAITQRPVMILILRF